MATKDQKAWLDRLLAGGAITQEEYDENVAALPEPTKVTAEADRLMIDADATVYMWAGILAMIVGAVMAVVSVDGGSAAGLVAGSAIVIVGALAIGVAVVAIAVRIGTIQAYAKMGLIPDEG